MKLTHKSEIIQTHIKVALVGCGGTGSQMLTKLVQIDCAMRAMGRGRLEVAVFDPDIVTDANIGRQLFYKQDIGLHKSIVLVDRVNRAMPCLHWEAFPQAFDGQRGRGIGDHGSMRTYTNWNIIITCVDSGKARAEIHKAMTAQAHYTSLYWMDIGNEKWTGQVILGQISSDGRPNTRARGRLPHVIDIYPAWMSGKIKETNTPSCSLAEALQKQSLFVNGMAATCAAQLLSDLLLDGQVEHSRIYFDVKTKNVNPWPVEYVDGKGDTITERTPKKRRAKRQEAVAA